MKLFFEYFPAKLNEKTAFNMIHDKMDEAIKAFNKAQENEEDSKHYLECLEKLKDMITIFMQEKAKEY